jgi:hypothetical protein
MNRNIRGVYWALTSMTLTLVALLLASPSRAMAYIDPGNGSFGYQAAYAAFMGGVFYLRKFLNLSLKNI